MPDLSPNFGSPLEWWYAQGRLAEADGREHHLMFCLYRVRRDGGDASMALVSLVDVAACRHATANVVSRPFVSTILDIATRVGAHVAPHPIVRFGVDLFAGMVRDEAWPGFALHTETAAFGAPLAVDWAGIELRQDDATISLAFSSHDNPVQFDLDLTTRAPWSSVGAHHLPGHALDGYRSCPRLDARGRVDGRSVEGSVWFEQQWGSLDQTILEERGHLRLIGWNWFGLNFDDGSDLLLYQRRDMSSGEPIDDFAVLFEGDDWRIVRDGFRTRPRSSRRARDSLVSFPRRWRLESPSLDLALDFETEHDMAEVSILGPLHTLWEGPGRFAGVWKGRRVTGRGWVELYGWDRPLGPTAHVRFWGEAFRSLVRSRHVAP